ncbi:MAG: hypothetical protein ABGY13_11265 [Verrucomicrobiia bacterium]
MSSTGQGISCCYKGLELSFVFSLSPALSRLERELGQAHWAWLRGLLSRGHRVGRWFDLLDVAAGCVSLGLSAIKKGSSPVDDSQ